MRLTSAPQKLISASVAILAAIAGTVIAEYLVGNTDFFNSLEGKFLNELQFSAKPLATSADILLVQLDNDSGAKLSTGRATDEINRSLYGELIKGLANCRSSVILMDKIFVEPVPDEDERFFHDLEAAIDTKNTSIIFTKSSQNPKFDETEFDYHTYEFVIHPKIQELQGRVDIGFANPISHDLSVVGCLPFKNNALDGEELTHTALLAAWRHQRIDPSRAQIHDMYLELPAWEAQLGYNQEFPLQWINDSKPFQTISLFNALQQVRTGDQNNFKDKIIIISDIRDNRDEVYVPHHGIVKGSNVLANLINTALARPSERIRWEKTEAPRYLTLIASLIAGLLIQTRKVTALGTAIAIPFLAGLLAPFLIASTTRLVIPSLTTFLAIGISVAFGILSLALQAPQKDTRIAGELSEATILFSDLTASTEWVQKIGAVEYQRRFGSWLDICEKSIRKHGGHVERTTGDGFIAVFPTIPVKSTVAALSTCQEILEHMSESDFEVSFGFESGPVSGGYLIEAGRRVWSSSGTTVNLAKRLQSEAGPLKQLIVFGPIAARVLKESQPVQSLGHHALKGIEGEVEIFTSRANPQPAK